MVENIILLRYVDLRSHLYRLISILKMRRSTSSSLLPVNSACVRPNRAQAAGLAAKIIPLSVASSMPSMLVSKIDL